MTTATSRNIAYKTSALARYFASHRMTWDGFYPSERWVLDRVRTTHGIRRVLDVGCAAGGLGLALQERAPLERYVGVEINEEALEIGRARRSLYRCPVDLHVSDILATKEIDGGPFDLVANLSCSDWNIETKAITAACWRHVAPGGTMVISLRLTDGPSLNDFARSYQYIRYEGDASGTEEKANYVVFNVRDALDMLGAFEPPLASVLGYGYWGAPSKMAVTPYERLVFAVFAVTRAPAGAAESPDAATSELHLPLSLWRGRASDGAPG